MRTFEDMVDRSLTINQSGVNQVEIEDLLYRLQELSANDKKGLQRDDAEAEREPVAV